MQRDHHHTLKKAAKKHRKKVSPEGGVNTVMVDGKLRRLDDVEKMKAERCAPAARDVIKEKARMWERFKDVFALMERCFEGFENTAVSPASAVSTDVIDRKHKVDAMKRWGEAAKACAESWNAVTKVEQKHVGEVAEWWGKDWAAYKHASGQTDTSSPPHIATITAWQTLLNSPSNSEPEGPSASISKQLLAFSVLLQDALFREVGLGPLIRAVAESGKKAARAGKKANKHNGKVGPDGMGVLPGGSRAKLAKRLHELDVARFRLDKTITEDQKLWKDGFLKVGRDCWTGLKEGADKLAEMYGELADVKRSDSDENRAAQQNAVQDVISLVAKSAIVPVPHSPTVASPHPRPPSPRTQTSVATPVSEPTSASKPEAQTPPPLQKAQVKVVKRGKVLT
ncbi:hypothetical protein HK104_008642 [Borealophlyctis nickersoniae]|nr:hypothetical protein HK104_008642 [Borealophlyctis nickersoniae]